MTSAVTVVVVESARFSAQRLQSSVTSAGFDVRTVSRAADGSIAAAITNALSDSSSEYVAIVESDGWLSTDAGDMIRRYFGENPLVDIFYTDGASPGRKGRMVTIARPDFSPERLRCQFYWGDLVLYRRSVFDSLCGLDESLPGAELYDLALRSAASGCLIGHLARPLFESPSSRALPLAYRALESTPEALVRHLESTGGGTVRSVGADGVHDTRRNVRGTPLVSIVIPSRGTHSAIDGETRCYVIDAARSIMQLSTYRNFEIVMVLDTVAEPAVVAELATIVGDQLRIVEWARPFNFSEKVNDGVLSAQGDYILLLNDDVRVLNGDWIESLLALAQLPGAGMSGGLLYYEDDTIQHAGHGYFEGDASHIGLDALRTDPGPLDGHRVEREVSGVTAACAMMPRSVYMEVGGLSSLLPGNFNDVDLCMKVTWRGYSIYWTPHAELYHYESKTRDASVHSFEVDVAWGRWGFRMHDPQYWPYPHNRPPI